MASPEAAVAALALVLNGIAVGIMSSTVIGIAPYMRAQDYGGYVRMVRFLWPRFDPIMPMLNGSVLVLDAVLAVISDAPALRVAFAGAAVLLGLVMAISITKNVPVNRMVRSLDPDSAPRDWGRVDPRRRWQAWNAGRTALAVTAFVVNTVAVVALR